MALGTRNQHAASIGAVLAVGKIEVADDQAAQAAGAVRALDVTLGAATHRWCAGRG
jgi:hypothetical protein